MSASRTLVPLTDHECILAALRSLEQQFEESCTVISVLSQRDTTLRKTTTGYQIVGHYNREFPQRLTRSYQRHFQEKQKRLAEEERIKQEEERKALVAEQERIITENAKRQGYKVKRSMTADKKIQLVLVKRSY